MRKLLIILIATLSLTTAFSQDTIMPRMGKLKIAQVTDIGVDVITYKSWDNLEGPNFQISKNAVDRIIFANGVVQEINPKQKITSKAPIISSRRHAILSNPYSPYFNYTTIGFQKAIKYGISYAGSIGAIGIGVEPGNDARGLFVKNGVKIKLVQDVGAKDKKATIISGWYFQPEISVSIFEQTFTERVPNDIGIYHNVFNKENVASAALIFNVGNQHLLGSIFTIDYNFGLGYSLYDSYSIYGRRYSHVNIGQAVAINGTISLGILLK